MRPEDARRARRLSELEGPGGCKADECRIYCETAEHANECLRFAEEHEFISREGASIAREHLARFSSGPGGCRGFIECKNYCETPEHFEECIAFAKEHNLIPPEGIDKMRKAQELRQGAFSGEGPGGCKSPDECRAFCADPARLSICVEWASEHGHLSPEEANRILQNTQNAEAFQPGGGPGGCTTPEECYKYCSEHPAECPAFHSLPPGVTYPPPGETYPVPYTQTYTQYQQRSIEFGPCQGLTEEECYRKCSASGDQCRQCHEAYGFPLDKCPITSTQTYTYSSPPPTQTFTYSPLPTFQGFSECTSQQECYRLCLEHRPECDRYCHEDAHVPQCREWGYPYESTLTPPPTSIGISSGPCAGLSEEQCKTYCTSSSDVCRQCQEAYGIQCPIQSPGSLSVSAPGNCKTADACRSYCADQNHSNECRQYGYQYPPQGFWGVMLGMALQGLSAATSFLTELFS